MFDGGTLTSQRYIDDILNIQVRFYAGAVYDQFILLDDNFCPHRDRVAQKYLTKESFERMDK
jgi:hypothetical protein